MLPSISRYVSSSNPYMRCSRAQQAMRLGWYDRAKDDLEKSLASPPADNSDGNYAAAASLLGVIHQLRGESAEALDLFAKGLARQRTRNLLAFRARLYLSDPKFQNASRAAADLTEALTLPASDADRGIDTLQLGTALTLERKLVLADGHLSDVIEHWPDLALAAHEQRASERRERNDWAGMLVDLDYVVEHEKSPDPRFYFWRMKARLVAGNPDDAARDARKFIELAPRDPDVGAARAVAEGASQDGR